MPRPNVWGACNQWDSISPGLVALAVLPYLAMIRDGAVPVDGGASVAPGLVQKRLHRIATGWNAFMALFSLWGTVQLGSLLVHPTSAWHKSDYNDLLRMEQAAVLYVYSKFWELIDTVLLYARGKRVGRLHWTHHVLTLVYSVVAFNQCSDGAAYFAALNYAVHTVMYTYYALLFWWPGLRRYGQYVTLLQISQFVWAMVYTWLYQHTFAPGTYVTAWLMYAYYLCEFVRFFMQRSVAD